MVGYERITPFPVLDFHDDRAVAPLRFNLFCAAALVPGPPESHFKTLRKEGKNVENSGFSTAVWAQKHREGRQALHLDILQGPEITYF